MKQKIVLLLLLAMGMSVTAQNETNDKGFEISKNLEIFANVYKNLHMNYVDSL